MSLNQDEHCALSKTGQSLIFSDNSKVEMELRPLPIREHWLQTKLSERVLNVLEYTGQRSLASPISLLNNLTLIGSNAETVKRFFTPDELADFLSISKASVYRLVNKRQIPFNKIGGSLRFRREDIDKFLDSQRIEPIKL